MTDRHGQLREARRTLERDIGQAKAIAARAKADQQEAADKEDLADALEEAVGLLNSFADERQREAQDKIEALVTYGLQSIFGPELSFHIVQEVKARRLETRFVVRSVYEGVTTETGILEARGGGVASVAGFVLRLVTLLLRPGQAHFLLLDESFAQLSVDREPAMAEFLRDLVDRTSAQVVLITHSPQFEDVADVAYRTSLDGRGRTRVVRVV